MSFTKGILHQCVFSHPHLLFCSLSLCSERQIRRVVFELSATSTYICNEKKITKTPHVLFTRYPHLPCLQVSQKKDYYLPLEVCTLIPCERRYLSDEQIENLIKCTARSAPERQRDIQYWVRDYFFISLFSILFCFNVMQLKFACIPPVV